MDLVVSNLTRDKSRTIGNDCSWADCVEEVGDVTVRDGPRSDARQFFSAQAGTGAGGGINFASFRRFWAVAARRNSS
jgi:hypothetical protein